MRAESRFLLHAATALVALIVAGAHGGKVLDEKRVAKHFSHGLGHVAVAPPGACDPVAYLGLVCGQVYEALRVVTERYRAHRLVCQCALSATERDGP